MRLILFLLLLSTSTLLLAQNASFQGTIRDKNTGESLPGVTVLLDDSSGTVSDSIGFFSMKTYSGKHFATFSSVGFAKEKKSFSISGDQALIVNIFLEPSASQLGTVVVSASRFEQKIEETMVSMEVLKPAMIENANTTTMETVIDQIPGVTVMDGSVSIRGGSGFVYGAGSRVLLLVDDLPMLSADAGDIKWTALPTENLEQVEIIKGASSALFGSSALDGVINLRTAYPKSTPEGKIIMYHGMYDNPKRKELKWWKNANPSISGTNFSYSKKFGQFDLSTGGNLFTDEGYRMGEKEQRVRVNANTRYRFKKISGLSAGINANFITTRGGNFVIWQDDSSGAYIPAGGLDTPATTLSNYVTSRMNVDPYIVYLGKKGASHKLRTRFFRTNNQNDTRQESIADFYYAEYVFGKKFKRGLNITAGFGGSVNIVRSGLYGNHDGRNEFAFAQIEQSFFKKLSVALGVRGEYFRVDSSETKSDVLLFPLLLKDSILISRNAPVKPVLRLGANYHLLKATYLRASFGEGYRFPTIAEKYIRTNEGAIYIFPNDSVRPETGWSAEFGVKQGFKISDWQGFFDVAAFWTEYHDMMEFSFGQWDTNPPPGTQGIGFKSRNVSDAVIKGIDVSLNGDGKIGAFHLTLMAGYTYMEPLQKHFNPIVDTLFGTANYNVLKYRYRHLIKADAEVGYKKASLGVSFRYNSFMENIDRAFSEFIPGVKHYRLHQAKEDYVFDGRVSFRFTKGFKLAFITKNILNREYMGRPADMQPPRSFVLQAEMKF